MNQPLDLENTCKYSFERSLNDNKILYFKRKLVIVHSEKRFDWIKKIKTDKVYHLKDYNCFLDIWKTSIRSCEVVKRFKHFETKFYVKVEINKYFLK